MEHTGQRTKKVYVSSKHRLTDVVPPVVLSRKEKLKLDLLRLDFRYLPFTIRQNKKLFKQIATKCGFKVIFEIAEERYCTTFENRDEQRKAFTDILEMYKRLDFEATRSAFKGLRLYMFKNNRPTINRDLHIDFFNTLVCPEITKEDFLASRANSFKAYYENDELSTSDLFAGDTEDFCAYFMSLK